MPCYKPITAYQLPAGGPLLFAEPAWGATSRGGNYNKLQISCGQCAGCRLKRSREWAARCIHEAQTHRHNCFITLTYADENLPENNSLKHRDFQLFMKKFRKALHESPVGEGPFAQQKNPHRGATPAPQKPVARALRYYMCGEYGETYGRPHYHAIIFGTDFLDKIYKHTTATGCKIYNSPTLEKLWPHGHSSIGDVTFESAAYVARYIMKKRTGDGNKNIYEVLDLETGELVQKQKEYNTMSRRPGIAKTWFDKYNTDITATGKIIIRGHKNNPPRYYDKLLKKLDELKLEEFQYARYIEQLAQTEHHTPERLAVQEQVAAAKTKSLQRKLT